MMSMNEAAGLFSAVPSSFICYNQFELITRAELIRL